MSDEWPAIYFSDRSHSGYGNYPGELKENMVISMEASFGREGARAGEAGRGAANHIGGP